MVQARVNITKNGEEVGSLSVLGEGDFIARHAALPVGTHRGFVQELRIALKHALDKDEVCIKIERRALPSTWASWTVLDESRAFGPGEEVQFEWNGYVINGEHE